MLPPRAYVFIGLNVIRALSIISLILVFSSSIMTLVDDVEAFSSYQNDPSHLNTSSPDNSTTVSHDYIPHSTVPNQPAGVFWAVLNRLLIIGQVIILFLSEIGWPSTFFDKFFPVLGEDFGLGALGVIQCLIGAAILSHHVNGFTLVSAFFLFSLGCLHMFVGLIFREKVKNRRCLTAWKERAKDVLPTSVNATINQVNAAYQHSEKIRPIFTGSSDVSVTSTKYEMGFGRQGEKDLKLGRLVEDLKPALLSRTPRQPALPEYAGHEKHDPNENAVSTKL